MASKVHLVALLTTILVCRSLTAEDLITVLHSEDPPPGVEAGVSFRSLRSLGGLSNKGLILLQGQLQGDGITPYNAEGIWIGGAGAPFELRLRTGDPTPGYTQGERIDRIGPSYLSKAGYLSVTISHDGPGSASQGDAILLGDALGLEPIIQTMTSAPGAPVSVLFSSMFSNAIAESGRLSFGASLSGPGVIADENDRGIWAVGGDTPTRLIARVGDPAPSIDPDVQFAGLGSIMQNEAGQVALIGYLNERGVNLRHRPGIWAEKDTTLQLVATTGQQAPGLSEGVLFTAFASLAEYGVNYLAIDGKGNTAFTANLSGPGLPHENAGSIWTETGGHGLRLVAKAGDTLPGDSGLQFNSYMSTPVLNEAGLMAFSSSVEGGSQQEAAIFTESFEEGLEVLAMTGDVAPGVDDESYFTSLSSPVLNGAGQAAFVGGLGSSGSGIWAQDSSGILQLIVRTGQTIDVDSGPESDLRTISFIDFFTNGPIGDSFKPTFNDRGQLAFTVFFEDGTEAIVISNRVATLIPEPTTLVVLLIGVSILYARRAE